MELINWSISAIDKIFSQRKVGPGEPTCPDGTFASGYVMDSWNSWQVLCLEALSVEDAEDLYMIGLLMAGILFFGCGIALTYRKIGKTAANKFTQPLSVEIKDRVGAVGNRLKELDQRVIQIEELNRNIAVRTLDTQGRVGSIGGQVGELLRTVTGLTVRLDEMSKDLHRQVVSEC